MLILLAGGCLGSLLLVLYLRRRYRLNQALHAPFPPHLLSILRRRLPVYNAMPDETQQQLLQLVKRFLLHKRFVGCAGLEVTDEMRVAVAATACLLLLNRRTLEFESVRWIYMYPAEFAVSHDVMDEAGVVSREDGVLSGEAWHDGKVILSWSDVEDGLYDLRDGYNVVLHEFAHQLDGESGSMNGAPLLYQREDYAAWSEVFEREYHALCQRAENLEYGGVLDTYGATNPAEFFAVATETFFEQPQALAGQHPELFDQLAGYYRVDPREWLAALDSGSAH